MIFAHCDLRLNIVRDRNWEFGGWYPEYCQLFLLNFHRSDIQDLVKSGAVTELYDVRSRHISSSFVLEALRIPFSKDPMRHKFQLIPTSSPLR